MAIDQLIQVGNDQNPIGDIEMSQRDVDMLLEEALNITSLDIMLQPDRQVSPEESKAFQSFLDRRLAHEPISQILGRRDFWSLTFIVNRHCLTPRPDSETLIEQALKAIPDRDKPLKILDMGTGSGCLLLSLMSEYPKSRGVGLDLSEQALAVAAANAQRLGFAERCDFLISDWAEQLPSTATFDVILSNPPYISEEERYDLAPDVRDYEPDMALFADENGYLEYQKLAKIIPEHLKEGGMAFLEIGHTQGRGVQEIFQKTDAIDIQLTQDLAGRDRCVILKY